MKAQSCLRPLRTVLPSHLSSDPAAPPQSAPHFQRRVAALALLVMLAPLTQQALSARQDWAQNPEAPGPQSVQANPESIVPPSKPSPYKYPPQPDLQPPQADPQPPRPQLHAQQPQPHAQQQQAHAKQQQAHVQPQHPNPQQGQAAAQQQQPRAQESQAYAQPQQADPPQRQLHAQLQYAPQPEPYVPQAQPYASQEQAYPPQQQPDPQQQYTQQPYADPGQDDPQYAQQPQQPAQPFAAEQLEQLVAPIALYPDALVAQILAASTYPAQVAAADNWLRSQGYATPDQIAYGADAQTNWDPSVKALTAFPQVLDLMNHDLRWTTDLGNAYYNQPQDILQTIQVMRQRAEDAGTLQSTPQEVVSNNQGYIQLAPVNPQVVYVPAYNPWSAYGQPVSPYPGFSFTGALGAIGSFVGNGMRFGAGIGMAAFSHTPFGWAGWALNWLASSILFHQSPYSSQSTSVAHWGNSRSGYYGSQTAGINRTPNGYNRPQQGYNRAANGYAQGNGYGTSGFTRPPLRTPENYAYNHQVEAPNRAYAGSYVRPAVRDYTYHPQQQLSQPARQQSYVRPGGYGNGFYSNSQQAYAARPATPYAGQQQAYRAPASSYQRNNYTQRSYADRSYANQGSYSGGRGYAESYAKQEKSGGSHMFGGGHGEESPHYSYKAPRMPKAPKAPRMSGGGHRSGGGGHSGGLFHHGGR
jgi:uncharacterized membrane protein YgcG